MGNTVGSREEALSESDLAYIAGFFDGDGSLIVQIKNRRDTIRGWRIMFTVCFYQDTRHKKPLQWMKELFNIGYLSDRNDGITELRINGYSQVKRVLSHMHPYIRFKKKQVEHALRMLDILENQKFVSISLDQKNQLADLFCKIREANYSSCNRKYSVDEIKMFLTK